jgi:hypothetical protein
MVRQRGGSTDDYLYFSLTSAKERYVFLFEKVRNFRVFGLRVKNSEGLLTMCHHKWLTLHLDWTFGFEVHLTI